MASTIQEELSVVLAMFKFLPLFYRRSRRRWLYPSMSVLLALGISVGTPQVSRAIPLQDLLFRGFQLIQISNMSDAQEVQMGRQINQELITSQVQLYDNPALTAYINRIGQRLARVSDRPNIPYTFQVVADNNINAFATMGGFVYINSGTIAAADNEAQLASVIAHEIGHIGSRHAVKDMKQAAIRQGISSIAGLDRSTAVQLGVQLALQLPNSREHEYEADRKGLITLGRAGYAQSAMPAFMRKLLNSSSQPTFLSNHPGTADRIVALQRAIPSGNANSGTGLNNLTYKRTISSFVNQ